MGKKETEVEKSQECMLRNQVGVACMHNRSFVVMCVRTQEDHDNTTHQLEPSSHSMLRSLSLSSRPVKPSKIAGGSFSLSSDSNN